MERRKFLIGTAGTALGGGAILGSGAFSRVASDRSVTIKVAEDPDAYMGLSKCRPDGETPTPNSSFVIETNDDGHIEIDMGDSGNDGFGVNSNSVTSFDNVFQITNQGKEPVCIDLKYNPVEVPDPEEAEEAGLPLPDKAVVFYKEDAREDGGSGIPNPDGGNVFSPDEIDINGPNAHPLDVGESICVGIQTRTFGISAKDNDEGGEYYSNLLEEVEDDAELKIVADVGGNCDPGEAEEICEIFGIDLTTDDQYIRTINVGDDGVSINSPIAGLSDDARVPGDENKPNGLAHDPVEEVFYYSSPTEDPGSLYTVDKEDLDDPPETETRYDKFEDASEGEISGAAFCYNGSYYYILDGDDELKKATIHDVGDEDSDVTVESTDITLPDSVSLGDIAINRDEEIVYVSSWQPSAFYKIDLNEDDPEEAAEDLTGDVHKEFPNKQIAYGVDQFGNPQLYGTDAGSGDWWELFPDSGAAQWLMQDEKLFTDLAACAEVFGDD